MDNIDEFMRQKFGSDDPAERFEFREEYWEQARVMLEAEEAQRRRRWLLWWIFAGACLISIPAWWYCRERDALDTNHGISNNMPISADIKDGGNAPDGFPEAKDIAAPDQNAGKKPGVQQVDSAAVQGNMPGNKKNAERGSPELPGGRTTKKGSSATSPVENRVAGAKNMYRMPATANMPGSGLNASSSNPAKKKSATQDQPVISEVQSPETPAPAGSKIFDPFAKTAPENTNAINPSESRNEPLSARPALFDPLPLPFKPVQAGELQPAPARPVPVDVVQRTDVFRNKRWGGFVSLAASYYPGTEINAHWGMVAGLSATYKIRPDWSLSLGINGRIMPSLVTASPVDSATAASATSLRYSFGYEREEFVKEPVSYNIIEFPLGIHWQKRSWSLESGITPGFLNTVRGRTVRYTSSSLHPAPEKNIERNSVKMDKTGHEKTFISVFAGVEWSATRNLGLFAKGTYMKSYRLKPSDSLALLKPSEQFWIDAGLRFRF